MSCENKISTILVGSETNSTSITSSARDMMTLHLICNMRDLLSVTVPTDSSVRDLHIEVSAKTSLSRAFFKLIHRYQILTDNVRLLSEFKIVDGSKIILNVNVKSGMASIENMQLSPARKAIRDYVLKMTPTQVNDFFDAKHGLCIKVPVRDSYGTLKFKLDEPMPTNADFYTEAWQRVEDMGQISQFHSVTQVTSNRWQGKFYGDLVPEVFNSKGVPGKTVDTIISIMDGILNSMV